MAAGQGQTQCDAPVIQRKLLQPVGAEKANSQSIAARKGAKNRRYRTSIP